MVKLNCEGKCGSLATLSVYDRVFLKVFVVPVPVIRDPYSNSLRLDVKTRSGEEALLRLSRSARRDLRKSIGNRPREACHEIPPKICGLLHVHAHGHGRREIPVSVTACVSAHLCAAPTLQLHPVVVY